MSGGEPTPQAAKSVPWKAIGAAIVGLAGIVGAVFAVLSFTADRSDKSKEQAARQAAEVRAQAKNVSAWIAGESPGGTRAIIRNTSNEPVHDVVAFLVLVQGAGPRTGKEMAELGLEGTSATLLTIPPGKWEVRFPQTAGGMHARPGIEVGFVDRAGRSWVRTARGGLDPIGQPPVRYYGLPEPVGWTEPSPLTR